MERNVWKEKLLEAVASLGEAGGAAVDILQARRAKPGFMRVHPNIGTFWIAFGNIRLNSRYDSYETSLDDLRLRTLIMHEARHLQQGLVPALSVYGELDAWQLELGVYYREKGRYPPPVIAERRQLPLICNRTV